MKLNFPECIDVIKFPDGQTHTQLKAEVIKQWTLPVNVVNIRAKIKSNDDLVNFCGLIDILRECPNQFAPKISVQFLYLIGQRDDRRMSSNDCIGLRVIARIINQLKLDAIQVFCPHSQSTLDLLQPNFGDCTRMANVEGRFFQNAIDIFNPQALVFPDQGASKRFYNDHQNLLSGRVILECGKHRDMQTGKLSGFNVPYESVPENVLILDDLCDAGGTFCGLAAELKKKGAKHIGLAIPHGIFSKGLPLQNIDYIYTTDSYRQDLKSDGTLTVMPV